MKKIVTATSREPQPKPRLLGDRIEAATRRMGIKPCAGCNKRKKGINGADLATRNFAKKVRNWWTK